MRFTLHAVHADDYPVLHTALQPSLRSWLRHAHFVRTGLTAGAAEEALPGLVAFASVPRTGPEVEGWLAARLGGEGSGAWWALRAFGPFHHRPTGGAWAFGPKPVYVAAGQTPGVYDAAACDAAMPGLVRRYLAAFGPATAADIAQFAIVQRSRVRSALAALGDEVEVLDGPGGATLFDLRGAPRPDEGVSAPPRLMAMWDSALLAYEGRRRLLPEAYRRHIIRTNGDVLPTLLVDGAVAGVWRVADDGAEVRSFVPLTPATWEALAGEAHSLGAFLGGRQPIPYRRYDHWWATLPQDGERKVLPF